MFIVLFVSLVNIIRLQLIVLSIAFKGYITLPFIVVVTILANIKTGSMHTIFILILNNVKTLHVDTLSHVWHFILTFKKAHFYGHLHKATPNVLLG